MIILLVFPFLHEAGLHKITPEAIYNPNALFWKLLFSNCVWQDLILLQFLHNLKKYI